uniref:Putative pvs-trna-like protein n=1 Tax=Eurycorymbus cavaleriei TaxID=325641 RepID=A0A2P1FSW7_9ROSI|nr:putative pvs-trna-like protein [Eurycorymbus cavaleriei]YP_009476245.1 putative pvs-trna-like protein [Eurycorymbus cavaleriei]YP_010483378.1 putative pvs-trna-like protein [Sinoradlkofera minor]YP_010483392.1 putative pvs-trna-like protein [Sinoradlkofera minor]AVM38235.1 putative pvs-trna-like protein [Eurycorymbus cavaleriei]AVM38249.1 putative pvs-trna-like protein [Eurycorymbus cavaleriei]ULD67212.1 putative pvs-trna-like protein [Eurycorymbus cavaleriei]ULD67226.1 putative pvs-trna-
MPDEGTLREPLTPTTVHVQSILDLTNRPSYLFYVLDSPSLSQ